MKNLKLEKLNDSKFDGLEMHELGHLHTVKGGEEISTNGPSGSGWHDVARSINYGPGGVRPDNITRTNDGRGQD